MALSSITYLSNEDNLSSSPFLCHILSLLDAKQVLRCMRVSKHFNNTIKNNWRDMQKIALNLEMRLRERNHFTRTGHTRKSDHYVYLRSFGDYPKQLVAHYYHVNCGHVEAKTSGKSLPVHNVFESREKMGFPTNIASQGKRREAGKSKARRGFKEVVRSLFGNSYGSFPEHPLDRESWLNGRFDVTDVCEGLSILLDMLLRCDVKELTLHQGELSKYVPEEELQTILKSVRRTGSKLIGTAKIFEYSETAFKILRELEAKSIEIQPDIILDCKTVRMMPTNAWRMEIYISGILFNSLKPIALLIQEWQLGDREIEHLELINKGDWRPYLFSASSFEEMLNTFVELTVTKSTEFEIRAYLGRERDSKLLTIEYLRKGVERKNKNGSNDVYAAGGLLIMKTD